MHIGLVMFKKHLNPYEIENLNLSSVNYLKSIALQIFHFIQTCSAEPDNFITILACLNFNKMIN